MAKGSESYRLQDAAQKCMLVVNFLFWIMTVGYILWLNFGTSNNVITTVLLGTNSDYIMVWIILIGAYLTGMVGYLGAVRIDITAMKAYLSLIGLFFLLEVVYIIYFAVTFPSVGPVLNNLEEWMNLAAGERSQIEQTYQCCGYDGPNEYGGNLPLSCFHLPENISTTDSSGVYAVLQLLVTSEVGCEGKGAGSGDRNWDLLGPLAGIIMTLQVVGAATCVMMLFSLSSQPQR